MSTYYAESKVVDTEDTEMNKITQKVFQLVSKKLISINKVELLILNPSDNQKEQNQSGKNLKTFIPLNQKQCSKY